MSDGKEYTVLIPINVTAKSPAEALLFALNDARDPDLTQYPWCGYIIEWVHYEGQDIDTRLEELGFDLYYDKEE